MVALCALVTLGNSCSKSNNAGKPSIIRASRITSNAQIVRGPASRSEIGDYLLENEHVRVVIQDLTFNRGSGLFGGSLIDADIKRPGENADIRGRQGQDSFGELFPAFFLEVIDPEKITIVNDGADGKAAVVEVSGRGGEFVTMLRLFNQIMVNSYNASDNLPRALRGKPPKLDQDPQIEFAVRYILEPGAHHVRVESTLRNISFKSLQFPNQGILENLKSILGVDLSDFTVPTGAVLGLGKLNTPFMPGVGYDLNFGLLDSILNNPIDLPALPGHLTPIIGTTSNTDVNYGFAMGFSSNGDSPESIAAKEHFVYAKDQQLNAKNQPFYNGRAKTDDMLFLFYASGFGGVFTHQLPTELSPTFCADSAGKDATQVCSDYVNAAGCASGDAGKCERLRNECVAEFNSCLQSQGEGKPSAFTFTNYLLIGDGDVSSLYDEYYKIRKTKTQLIQGRMLDEVTGSPTGSGEHLLLYTPHKDSGCKADGDKKPYIVNQVTTKNGGIFQFNLPSGQYCYRTRGPGRPLGKYVAFEVKNKSLYIEPVAKSFATLVATALDSTARPLPTKVSVVGIHDFEGDKAPQEFLADLPSGEPYRTTDFVKDVESDPETRKYVEAIDYTDATGQVTMRVRPGKYRVYFSRGPEFELSVQEVTLRPGKATPVQGTLVRSVDTSNYVSGDFHMHAEGSIDSGLPFSDRALSLAAEGLEVVAATDHNYIADYSPFITAQQLDPFVKSMIGLELTTFEAGHFNGFPIRYDIDSSNRGSFEWQDQPPGLLFEELRQMGSLSPDDTIIQVNHPRDSILGYFSQHNVNAFDTTVELPFKTTTGTDRVFAAIAAASGPAFYQEEGNDFKSTFSWNFDAIEVFNGKRFELLRHHRATKAELRPVYIEHYKLKALEEADYDKEACDEARACDAATDNDQCATENALVTECTTKENDATAAGTIEADKHLGTLGDKPIIVCDGDNVSHPGHLDDWYNLLNRPRQFGLQDYERNAIADPARRDRYDKQLYRRYTATGNSDSHQARTGDEPGYPRNYLYVGHDDPARVTDKQVVDAIKQHRVIVTNGPFVDMTINSKPLGSDVIADDGRASITLTVRAASWVGADRYKLIGNGEVVKEGTITMENGQWQETIELNLSQDTWFVVEIEGDQNLFPVLLPAEIPPLDIQTALGSLAGPFGFGGGDEFEGLEPDLTFAMRPVAFTNPIWVIVDKDGTFTPPNPVAKVCKNGVFDPTEIKAADWKPMGERRLDAVRMPFKMHQPSVLSRLKGERRDVRAFFEAWAHNH